MSAACAPATATNPAAVPRRRLFIIFVISQPPSGCLGRDRFPRALLTLESPAPPPAVMPVALVFPLAAGFTELVTTSGVPPPWSQHELATHIAEHAIMK